MAYRPLADRIRPTSLDEVVGQEHILGETAILRRLIGQGNVPNMVFYGPSGVGKTTVANIIAATTKRTLHHLNATTASSSDIKGILEQLDTLLAPNGILLYLDEIQYFTKKQQQTLLECMENGKITLIAATTENPYFYVYNAILSRATVFEFRALTAQAILPAITRAVRLEAARLKVAVSLEDGTLEYIAQSCGGDVRKALNAVELLYAAADLHAGTVCFCLADAQAIAQKSAMRYDRDGDSHYDVLSALQKSIRGSDPNAAVHYLARLLECGDLTSPCRRILVTAAEDVGLAHPQAMAVTKACVDAALQLGLPEARIPLAEAVIFLATLPKSNSAIQAIDAAIADVRKGLAGEIPRHLQDTHYSGAQKLGRGGYVYPHAYPNAYYPQQYLPDSLQDARYYTFGNNKMEQMSKRYWDEIMQKS